VVAHVARNRRVRYIPGQQALERKTFEFAAAFLAERLRDPKLTAEGFRRLAQL
jgi:hypothetical protein